MSIIITAEARPWQGVQQSIKAVIIKIGLHEDGKSEIACQTAKVIKMWMNQHKIIKSALMDWIPYFPDLKPIERKSARFAPAQPLSK